MIIFIAGNSRSGTTMMSRILGNHENIFTFQELHFFDECCSDPDLLINRKEAIKLYSNLCAIQRNGYFGSRNGIEFEKEAANKIKNDPISGFSIYKLFLDNEAALNHKKIPCEQTPQNIFSIETILKNLPDARFIVMIRDPREILLSQKNKWKRKFLTNDKFPLFESIRSAINYHPITISRLWNAAIKEGLKFKNNPAVLFVHYENVISEPEKTIRNICNHCGIDFHPEMLHIPVIGSSNSNDDRSRHGIAKDKAGLTRNGRLNKTELYLCQKITSFGMEESGYKKDVVQPNRLLLNWYYFSQPFRLGLSLFFNIKRLKNPGKLIKKFF